MINGSSYHFSDLIYYQWHNENFSRNCTWWYLFASLKSSIGTIGILLFSITNNNQDKFPLFTEQIVTGISKQAPPGSSKTHRSVEKKPTRALAGVAQWIECWPVD